MIILGVIVFGLGACTLLYLAPRTTAGTAMLTLLHKNGWFWLYAKNMSDITSDELIAAILIMFFVVIALSLSIYCDLRNIKYNKEIISGILE